MGLRKLAPGNAVLLLAVVCVAALLGQGAGQGAAREAESTAFQRTARSYSRAGGCTPLHAEVADYLDMPPDRHQEAPDDDDDEGEQGDDVGRWLETQHFVAHRGRRQRPLPDDAGGDRGPGGDRGSGGEESVPSDYWHHGPTGLGIREQLEALLDAQEPPGDGGTATPPPPPAPARHTGTGRPGPAFRLEHIFAPTRGRRSGGTDLAEREAAPPRLQQRPSRRAWHRAGQQRACGRQQAMTLALVQERLRACEARLGSGDGGRVDQQPQAAGQSAPPSTTTAAPAENRPTGTGARRQRAYSILLTLR
ncbi:proline-rich proteoglycan 2-like isoform X2 [Frankliniella occidentalis]|uniref:Proline-rich proteoglycan 2-like isoform X2 n=1 Tax=Frankliniella occidentalis TaxID=133901 RepID=A0A9C6U026_FRAOC|nr:proline-rich proteoglycan 2-like isoform X2 [Frankliniella occidentalis]